MTIGQNKYRTLFISDFHLGSKHCQAERLLNLLQRTTADTIYLIGDILNHHTYLTNWPPFHNDVLSELANKALLGPLIYVPGNHDAVFRHHLGTYGNMTVALTDDFYSKYGRKYLVTHGDETDMLGLGRLLAVLIFIEKFAPISLWEILRKFLGGVISSHTKRFEAKMRKRAKGYDGVICGHIHFPCIKEGYLNSGDWFHHCTAVVENHDGSFELLKG